MRILIVEDSPLLRKMFGLAFSSREHYLRPTENGRDALAVLLAEQEPYDVILLDLRMPDMNGVEFIGAVRERPLYCHAPIVLTTAEPDDSALLQQAKALGVAAIVRKPWTPQGLRAVVQDVLNPTVR